MQRLSHGLKLIIPLALVAVIVGVGSLTLLGSNVSQTFGNVASGLDVDGGGVYVPAAPAVPASEQDVELPAPTAEPRELAVNPFVNTGEDNLSTFAIDVDTASYTVARNYITNGQHPPADLVRVEEFVNYFHYDYPAPQDDAFSIHVDAASSPLNTPGTQVVRVGIQGKRIDNDERENAMLTFVVDVSGSMNNPTRLPLVKESLHLLTDQLRESDKVAIVAYGSRAYTVLQPTRVEDRNTIHRAIDSLRINGSTNAEDGLKLGYRLAASNARPGIINRVILCSDGVANVGATGPDAILDQIRVYSEEGIYLTTVGFGMGEFNDYLMEQLANDGNGNYGYVDTIDAAQRFFVEDLNGTLQVIAKDVKIQVEFNPAVVERYRLLGYENRAVADSDFRNDSVDAGEIGAGHSVTALYEIMPTQEANDTALVVQVRYADPESGAVREVQQPFASSELGKTFDTAAPDFQLAVVVAGFAEQLRSSGYAEGRSLSEVLLLARTVAAQLPENADVQELVELVQRASNI